MGSHTALKLYQAEVQLYSTDNQMITSKKG